MKRISRWILPVVLIAAAVGITRYSISKRDRPSRTPPPTRVSQVVVAHVEPATATPIVSTRGVVEARWQTELKAQVAGEVVELADALQPGELVEAGTVLVRLDPTDYESKLAEAESRLAQAEFSMAEEELRGEQARQDWERSGVKSDIPDFTARVPHLARATSQQEAARLLVKQAHKDLERTTIRAPYRALVRSRRVSLGSYAQPGSVIAELASIDEAEVRLPVPPREASLMEPLDLSAPGWDPTVTLWHDGQGPWTGRVVRVEGWLEEATRNVMVVAEITEPYTAAAGALRLGTFVEAQLLGRPRDGLYQVPETALQNRNILWTVNDADTLQSLRAEWVYSLGDKVWVHVEGTPDRLRYVVRPHSGFVDGTVVQVKPTDSPSRVDALVEEESSAPNE